ncbi:MAG: NADH-quinone oxidoreductase subunit N [Nitrospinota bacterium]
MPIVIPDISLAIASPEVGMVVLICTVLIADMFISLENKAAVGMISLAGVVILGVMTLSQWNEGVRTTFSGFYVADNFSVFVKMIILSTTAITILLSLQYTKVERINYGEYYAMILFAVFGMMVMASGNDIMSIYLGLETMSISSYVLVSFIRHDPKSREAGLKYFLMGAFASGLLLYGIALTYGLTGTTSLQEIAKVFAGPRGAGIAADPVMVFSLILFVAGFGFKLALVPFHMWLPDAYTGAPTTITAFMSVAVKMATLAGMMRIFFIAFPLLAGKWNLLLWMLAAFTMVWGNVAAIAQTSLKRMLAYSSIAHAGYILMGVVATTKFVAGKAVFTSGGVSAVLFYLAAYMVTNLGAFGMLIYLCREDFRGDNIEDWRGVGQAKPWAGLAFIVFFLSLGGLPPTAGFVGKLFLFGVAIQNEYYWLAVIGILSSAVSIYYYFRVIMLMYMEPRSESQPAIEFSTAPSVFLALVFLALATLYLGLFPGSFIDAARGSVAGFI